jgi:hypothetical protein
MHVEFNKLDRIITKHMNQDEIIDKFREIYMDIQEIYPVIQERGDTNEVLLITSCVENMMENNISTNGIWTWLCCQLDLRKAEKFLKKLIGG